jgi:adenylate cyclase
MDKEVTVFFSDVRSFTSISEKLGSPDKLIALMNDYMTPMVDIIMKEKGTIDKFIGDAIMAYWNAPKDLLNHQDHAVRASLNQLKTLAKLNETIEPKYGVSLDIGIGLNTGVAVVGEMGSSGRSDYTIIGDPVNLGSRLEGLCKPYGVRLIISEFTKNGLQDDYVIRELDLVRVKGKELPVGIYEVLDFGPATPEQQSMLDAYNQALGLYKDAQFAQALEGFKALNEKEPHTVYSIYIERCEHFIQEPPEDFDGVFTHTSK